MSLPRRRGLHCNEDNENILGPADQSSNPTQNHHQVHHEWDDRDRPHKMCTQLSCLAIHLPTLALTRSPSMDLMLSHSELQVAVIHRSFCATPL